MEVSTVTEKKTKSKKPLPPGYVCKACGKVDDHAIYDCTLAIKKPKKQQEDVKASPDEVKQETETSVKKEASVDRPKVVSAAATVLPLTVFVTGLPFSINRKKVIDIFQSKGFASDITGKNVKLLMFEDSPEKCRGLAYVSLELK
jgi:RNA recognition motif-containing protein